MTTYKWRVDLLRSHGEGCTGDGGRQVQLLGYISPGLLLDHLDMAETTQH